MALSEVTTTFNVHDFLGANFDPRRAKGWATNNADNQKISDTSTGETRVGSGTAVIAADGTGTFTHWAPGVDANPASWQTTYHFDVTDRATAKGRRTVSFGPYTVTTSGLLTDLEAEQEVPPTYLSQVTEQLEAIRDEAQAAADLATDISGISTSDALVETLVKNPASLTAQALLATIGTEVETPGTPANLAARDLIDVATAPVGAGVSRFIARAKAGASLKIVALGDSILAGTGATLGTNDAVTKTLDALAARFPTATITQSNRALSGATTATSAINGKVAEAVADAGDLYIVGFGRNDITVDDTTWAGAPTQGYKRERSLRYFEVMIRAIRERVPQADILIVTENPADPYSSDANMRTYQEGVRNLAAAYGAELADTYAAYGTSGYTSLLSDSVHPSVAGHQVYADAIVARIPASPIAQARGAARATLAKGVRTAEAVDTTIGTFGWTVANGSAPPANYTQNGAGWNGTYPRSTTGVGDYMEWAFTGTDFGIRLDQSSGAALVVDIAVDGVPTYTNQSLHLVPSAFQLFQFIATGLSDGAHTVRLTLKSGTMTWYQAAWLAGAPVEGFGDVGGVRRMKPLRYYTQPRLAAATVCFLNSGDAYVVPIWIPKATAVDKLAVDVTTAVASSTITLGIYSGDAYDQPGSLITQTAAMATTSTGWKESTLTGVTLQKGWHWLSLIGLGGFAASALRVRGADLPSPLVTSTSGTLANVLNSYLDAGEATLPATWTSTAAAGLGPLIVLRAA